MKTFHLPRTRIWNAEYLHARPLDDSLRRAIQLAVQDCGAGTAVLDLGCGQKPYARLFRDCRYISLDHSPESNPDIVADASSVPLPDGAIDIILCSQVIEHVPNPAALIRECRRLLKASGRLILSGPFYWPLHEKPHDYYRFTKHGLIHLLTGAGFSIQSLEPTRGDWAQALLSVNLQLKGKWWIPARLCINILGIILDRIVHSERSPSNYVVVAR